MSLDLAAIRKQFPSLDRPAIFFDNPGGTQISKQSLDRINRYLLECNANHDGAFATSVASDAILDEAHHAMADFLNACGPEEIVFGANMTTLTLYISRSISRDWKAGDEIVVTRLDHDANVTPWVLAAQDRGCKVIWVDFHPEDGTLNIEEMRAAYSPTKSVRRRMSCPANSRPAPKTTKGLPGCWARSSISSGSGGNSAANTSRGWRKRTIRAAAWN